MSAPGALDAPGAPGASGAPSGPARSGRYDAEALDAWKALWFRLTPAQREEKQHWKEKIEGNIRLLEKQLNVPPEKRVFPN